MSCPSRMPTLRRIGVLPFFGASPPRALALRPLRVCARDQTRSRPRGGAARGADADVGRDQQTAAAAHGGEAALLAGGAALLLAAASYGVVTYGVEETLALAKGALADFTVVVHDLGPAGWLLYCAAYGGMEVLLLPATPLALTAGALFGVLPGTMLSALGGLCGAVTSFCIARYLARDRVLAAARGAPQFAAIDRAIGRDGFKMVLLTNLSPLASLQNLLNYAYGVTSIELPAYSAASALALLPRTWATVSAGSMGRTLLAGEEGALGLGAGLLVALAATVYVAGVAKDALTEMHEEAGGEPPER